MWCSLTSLNGASGAFCSQDKALRQEQCAVCCPALAQALQTPSGPTTTLTPPISWGLDSRETKCQRSTVTAMPRTLLQRRTRVCPPKHALGLEVPLSRSVFAVGIQLSPSDVMPARQAGFAVCPSVRVRDSVRVAVLPPSLRPSVDRSVDATEVIICLRPRPDLIRPNRTGPDHTHRSVGRPSR